MPYIWLYVSCLFLDLLLFYFIFHFLNKLLYFFGSAFKNGNNGLAGMAQWLIMYQGYGSIPGQATCLVCGFNPQ